MNPEIPVAILAGGLATRLRPVTETIPKVLVPVAGKPFLAHQLDSLRGQGIKRVVLCVGHMGDRIEREFGDGCASGIRIDYSFDGPHLLGTGGAIQKALPLLGDLFFVLYGDSYLSIDFAEVANTLYASGRTGLMTVFRNQNRWDSSNVCFAGGQIVQYDKRNQFSEMQFIDYGLSLFRATAFDDFPSGHALDLADVLQTLVQKNELAGYEAKTRFYEIGSHAGLAELDEHLKKSTK